MNANERIDTYVIPLYDELRREVEQLREEVRTLRAELRVLQGEEN